MINNKNLRVEEIGHPSEKASVRDSNHQRDVECEISLEVPKAKKPCHSHQESTDHLKRIEQPRQGGNI